MITQRHSQPLPVSGEQVMMPPAGSSFNKPVVEKPEHRHQEIVAGLRRASWEATPEGQARTRDISQQMRETHGVTASAGQIYDDLRRSGRLAPHTGPTHYDTQLPGMADPNAAPRPPKWEELSPQVQAHTHAALARHGTTIDQMRDDFGAQHDQAVSRMLGAGHDRPYASTFYSTGEPREVIRSSAAKLGIPQTVHAQLNAFTSPNTKFSANLKSGETVYPNDLAAQHSFRHAEQGGDPATLRTKGSHRELRRSGLVGEDDPRRVQGYPRNLEKAAQASAQHLAGIKPADWKTGEGAGAMGTETRFNEKTGKEQALGGSPWRSSPKTGPYANSWSDSHPQYFVSDVHSGGGGMVPHLDIYKGWGENKQKNEREVAIERVPHFHAAADYAARQAMGLRGQSSVRETQAGQWGEEQIQRHEDAKRRGVSTGNLPTEAMAYPSVTKRQTPGQQSLF
jgi:hypothetical protein